MPLASIRRIFRRRDRGRTPTRRPSPPSELLSQEEALERFFGPPSSNPATESPPAVDGLSWEVASWSSSSPSASSHRPSFRHRQRRMQFQRRRSSSSVRSNGRRSRSLDRLASSLKSERASFLDNYLITKTVQKWEDKDKKAKGRLVAGFCGSFDNGSVDLDSCDGTTRHPLGARKQSKHQLGKPQHKPQHTRSTYYEAAKAASSNKTSKDVGPQKKKKLDKSNKETTERSGDVFYLPKKDDQAECLTCAICLVDYEHGDVISMSHNPKCKHHFHKECIKDWLLTEDRTGAAKHNENCPCCRSNFLSFGDDELHLVGRGSQGRPRPNPGHFHPIYLQRPDGMIAPWNDGERGFNLMLTMMAEAQERYEHATNEARLLREEHLLAQEYDYDDSIADELNGSAFEEVNGSPF